MLESGNKSTTRISYPLTLNGQFLCKGDNFSFYGFLERRHIEEKGIWGPGLELFTDCQLLKKEAITTTRRDRSTQHCIHLA